jgi:hypothetical protein
MSRVITWRRDGSSDRQPTEAKLLLIGIPVLLWTLIPIYHMVLFAISPRKDQATTGRLWPKNPRCRTSIRVPAEAFLPDHFLGAAVELAADRVSVGGADAVRLDLRGLCHQPPARCAAAAR